MPTILGLYADNLAKVVNRMPTIAGAAANTKKKQPTTGLADLDEYGNYSFDWSNVDSVNDTPRFLEVTLGKGHKRTSRLGETKIMRSPMYR
jgi:hypothetical protein